MLHRHVERLDRLWTPDEQRNDHVGEDHHVAQRQQREGRVGPAFEFSRHGGSQYECRVRVSWVGHGGVCRRFKPARAPIPLPLDQECAAATLGCSANIKSGLPSLAMVASSTITRERFTCDGRSYITSSSTCSRIDLKPRAPVLRASARLAIACSAGSRISSSTPSMRNIF